MWNAIRLSRNPAKQLGISKMLDRLLHLDPARIRPNPEQPREVFKKEALESLVASIQQYGILEPLIAEQHGLEVVLVAGERRLRAAMLAGLVEVPVVVRGNLSSKERLELALVENLQRQDLDPIEAARGYQRLIQEYRYTQEQVASRVGLDRATVANALRLLKLPEAGQAALREGKITTGHALALLGVEGEVFSTLLQRVMAEDLSVRATEALVRIAGKARPVQKKPLNRSRLETQLSRHFSARVRIESRKDGGGRLLISFGSEEELERLVSLMEGE
jgi:ParB family chromosome partitioning protein